MLWAVTTYFNPERYQRRLANYREFRARLEAPLIAVELGFDGRFELDTGDAKLVLRIEEGAVLWQKERLVNIALDRLPDDCDAVLCIDCDVFFLFPEWCSDAVGLLDRYPVVQPYSSVLHLDRDWSPGSAPEDCIDFKQPALAAVSDPASHLVEATRRSAGSIAPGHAWLYRREILCKRGLFDTCIVGGGDTAIACAAWGVADTAVALHRMTVGQEARYRDWARSFHDAVQGRVGSVDRALAHLWHGSIEDRRPRDRHLILAQHDFEPALDLEFNPMGAWEWGSDKPLLHEKVRGYFAARREDGT